MKPRAMGRYVEFGNGDKETDAIEQKGENMLYLCTEMREQGNKIT